MPRSRRRQELSARYDFPQSIHGLIGPSVALASYDKSAGTMLIWAGSQNNVQTRVDVAQMLGIPVDDIRVIWSGSRRCSAAAASTMRHRPPQS